MIYTQCRIQGGGARGARSSPPFLPRFYSKLGGCGQNRAPRPPSLAKYLKTLAVVYLWIAFEHMRTHLSLDFRQQYASNGRGLT